MYNSMLPRISLLAAFLVCVSGLALDLCILCGSDRVCSSACHAVSEKRDSLVDKRQLQLDMCFLCGSDQVCSTACHAVSGKRAAQLYRRQLCQACGTFQIGCWGVCTNPGEVIGKRDCTVCGDNARCALVCNLI